MKFYRIDRTVRRDSVLSGKGAELFGGRWNRVGIPIVYAAESRALAMLEILAHLKNYDDAPTDRIMVTIELRKQIKIKTFRTTTLPKKWNARNNDLEVQKWMNPFIAKHAIIRVPSVIVPEEFNFLINPNHPDFGMVRVAHIHPLKFDSRLLS